jgi:Spy/CpxP family protein refolding chaperone
MKISFLPLLFIGAALTAVPLRTVLADDNITSGQSTPSDGSGASSGNAATGQQCHPRLRKLFAELDLTDAQKEQIKQIFTTVTDRKERREQMWQVLTPVQQAKLKELREEHKNGGQPGAGTPATPSAT